MDGEEDEPCKHLIYKNQINKSLLKVIYLSVIRSYKVTMDGAQHEHIYFSYKHLLYKNQINNS